MQLFKSEKTLWLLVFIILMLKLLLFIYLKLFIEGTIFGGGSDADYYHFYALGSGGNGASNIWPDILRFLNEVGLYNRDIVSLILFVTSYTLLPYIYYKLVKLQDNRINPVKAGSVLLIIFYPSIFFFTLDVYREVFMFTILLLSLLLYKKILKVKWLRGNFYFLIFLSMAFFLFLLRPYLGFALGLTPFVYLIFSKTKKYIKSWIILYFAALILAKVTGVLDPLLIYRASDGFVGGGSTLGIELLNKDPVTFLVYYLYSFFGQMLGLFLVNIGALLVFFLESVPFIVAFVYLYKNIRFMTRFSSFLLVFFIIYTTVWVLANDNLGTALRLRIPSYLVIFACMFIVYQVKTKLMKIGK
mgnify:CR=1 FL=1|tara:strand:- start:336 stop:1409 length:1074 start_codon:yes stop_codon:yes gene_type:complete